MSELYTELKSDIKDAMKARDTDRLATLRMLHSSIKNKSIDVGGDMSDDDVISVLAKEAKKRRESAEAFDDGDRPELAQKERDELAIIKEYLPEPLSDQEAADLVDQVIEQTGAEDRSDMGKVMGAVVPQIKGRYDATDIKDIVLDKLG